MAQLIADRRDIDFVLHEQLDVGSLSEHDTFADFNKKTVDLIVSEARNLAIKEILPLQKISDNGCLFKDGKVSVPEEFHRVYAMYRDGEWLAMTDDPRWGGQGMPHSVSKAANEYFYGACNAFMLYQMLTHGAAMLVENFGTEAQKAQCLEKMLSGRWSGTMLLTEPEAGSDVGALTTTARKNGDGTFHITGNKIFISAGEHDMVENIIHPVLARIEGAPAGTRGISLFLVPKFRINADGNPGEFNDVVCTGVEEKMGLHGNSTCSLALGQGGACIGTLLGEENKGMAAMFRMMNEARQMVGLQGLANASAAYMYALNYARERIQTKAMDDPPGSAPAAIIRHPDVRRQLLTMKAYVDGMRSLVYFSGLCHDRMVLAADPVAREKYNDLIEILTPIVKGYVTDRAFEVCSHAIQVYGGYGYVEEYPVAQLLRDSRIFQLYEGTNGIQSIDLLARKVGMKQSAAFLHFLEQIRATVEAARSMPGLETLAGRMGAALDRYAEVTASLGQTARSEKMLNAFAFSHPFLEATGDLSVGWMLLWRAAVAASKRGKKKKDEPFYDGQIQTARFFINAILPVTMGRLSAIEAADGAVVEIADAGFGG